MEALEIGTGSVNENDDESSEFGMGGAGLPFMTGNAVSHCFITSGQVHSVTFLYVLIFFGFCCRSLWTCP